MRITQSWRVGEYLFTQHRDHGLKDYEGRPLYGFKIDGKKRGDLVATKARDSSRAFPLDTLQSAL